MNKLKYLKAKIRIWARLQNESLNSRKSILKAELADLDGVIDKREGSDDDGHRRREVVRLIQEVEKVDAMKVSNEEIKRAVWDCGIDKAPGPDGFTFGFYRRYWDIIGNDVVDSVKWFFCMERSRKEVLSNRLVTVLDDIVDEIQSAFVTDRQILDGPFILNEIVHWCKNKKKQSMIFKVDFEKAYDSVRWDFIDDILRRFGFGEKWCKWIQSCLYSSRVSVLVNGSPTKEFQFHKGLKQGDPLSPFLFTLVMENLHVSFQIVVDAGSRVGDLMSCIQSWHDVTEGMHTRLSKWKLKTLSIRGRLTLLKSVLGAIPIYNMSIFKVPTKVIQNMESIRARFFNGVNVNSKKPSWVRWKSVLAAKDVGGLGVSSLFALNRALMFKWVWRFFSQKNSLWVRVVKALHGEDEKIGKKVQPSWCGDIAFKNLVPRLYALESMKNIEVASKLSHGGDFSMSSVRKLNDNDILPKGISKTRWIKEAPSVTKTCLRRHMLYSLVVYLESVQLKDIYGQEDPSMVNVYDEVVYRSFYWIRFRCKFKFSFIDWLKNPNLVLL
uniref:RNA-directed DNA polymerase, eukaryota, reverse transcriptase zinc-binding domain protein n=1 Tax=Tanacetum cinerariifolium TaxID=118510 RepID=A0A699H1V2_TANCI|nr:RNA-directed DNA polymerase, eukaryota, reverse transcriptase zinc-binding domain protein [Tanacetum cinerariifolium]